MEASSLDLDEAGERGICLVSVPWRKSCTTHKVGRQNCHVADGVRAALHHQIDTFGSEWQARPTTPLRNPEFYQYDLNLPEITEVWRCGSVIRSCLLDLTAVALLSNPQLRAYGGRVCDSGEGRWTIQPGIDEAVPTRF